MKLFNLFKKPNKNMSEQQTLNFSTWGAKKTLLLVISLFFIFGTGIFMVSAQMVDACSIENLTALSSQELKACADLNRKAIETLNLENEVYGAQYNLNDYLNGFQSEQK